MPAALTWIVGETRRVARDRLRDRAPPPAAQFVAVELERDRPRRSRRRTRQRRRVGQVVAVGTEGRLPPACVVTVGDRGLTTTFSFAPSPVRGRVVVPVTTVVRDPVIRAQPHSHGRPATRKAVTRDRLRHRAHQATRSRTSHPCRDGTYRPRRSRRRTRQGRRIRQIGPSTPSTTVRRPASSPWVTEATRPRSRSRRYNRCGRVVVPVTTIVRDPVIRPRRIDMDDGRHVGAVARTVFVTGPTRPPRGARCVVVELERDRPRRTRRRTRQGRGIRQIGSTDAEH